MKIFEKPVIRAEIQTWIGKGDTEAKHWFGYLYQTENYSEHQTKKEHLTQESAMVETIELFNELYGLGDYILIFCSRAAFCTI